MSRHNLVIALATLATSALIIVSVVVFSRGSIVYVPRSTPVPQATPMDVTLKMRGADGEIQEIWVCKYSRSDGWVCEKEEELGE